MKTGKKHTLSEYASRYGVSKVTVSRWKKKGIDLDDEKSVRAYQEQKDHGGAKTLEEREAEPNENFAFPTPKVEQSGELAPGAAAALARLETMEVQAYEQMDWAMKEGKPFAIKAARENWLKLGDSLRRYDTMIAEARRATGATLPRAEIERILTVLAWYLRMAARQLATSEAKNFAAEDKPELIARGLEDMFGEAMLNAVAALVSTSEGKLEVPGWVSNALMSDLKELYRDVEAQCAARVDGLKQLAARVRKEPAK